MNNYETGYYRKGDNCPVEDFIRGKTPKEAAKITSYIDMLELKGPFLVEPYVKKVSEKIYELRPGFSGSEFRLFYFWFGNKAVFVHAIVKKDQKLKRKDIKLAEKRMKEITGG